MCPKSWYSGYLTWIKYNIQNLNIISSFFRAVLGHICRLQNVPFDGKAFICKPQHLSALCVMSWSNTLIRLPKRPSAAFKVRRQAFVDVCNWNSACCISVCNWSQRAHFSTHIRTYYLIRQYARMCVENLSSNASICVPHTEKCTNLCVAHSKFRNLCVTYTKIEIYRCATAK